MKIVNQNEGAKIAYEVDGQKITFDDDLTINLAKRQQDWAVHIDVCRDADGGLVLGAAAGRAYVAQLDIPAREYIQTQMSRARSAPEAMAEDVEPPQAIPLDMEQVTLTLWAI